MSETVLVIPAAATGAVVGTPQPRVADPVTGQQYTYDRKHAESGLGPRFLQAERVCGLSR